MSGFLLIDKANGVTSFDVVRDVRRATGIKKVGHSGTLDPLATGLLVVAVGEATKLLEYLIGCDKEYEVLAKFGEVSDTFDAEGSIESLSDESFSQDIVEKNIAENFVGDILQVPPKYSALKINGRRACDLVREGQDVTMKSRKIVVNSFEVIDFDWPLVRFRISCGSGTYIRSLVHDLGQKLSCGAYVKELRRNSVGKFSVLDAVKVEDLSNKLDQSMLPMSKAVSEMDFVELDADDMESLKDGKVSSCNKVDQEGVFLALHAGVVVGVINVFDHGESMKFKKRIFS